MSLRNLARPLLALAERLVTALLDPARRERTVAGLLIAYTAIWTLFADIARSSRDIHFDMAEIAVWSQELALGHPKHPQFAAWVTALWFSIFPFSDWAFFLLSMASVTLALWVSWRLSARWLDEEKRIVGLALLTLVPFFNFNAIKYNVNTVLVPLWAITTLWFVRSFETRRWRDAAFAGVGAAASMMGKYWSIFLLIGLGLAAIIDPRRRAYFRSPAPWVTIAIGILVLSPHLYWLATHDFSSLSYPLRMHGHKSLDLTTYKAIRYLAVFFVHIALPLALIFLVARPDKTLMAEIAWPKSMERRFAAVAFWTPILLPIPIAFAVGADLVPIWAMSTCTLLPVVLLSSPAIVIPREAMVRIVALALIFPFAATLVIAPAKAIVTHKTEVSAYGTHYRQLAEKVGQIWRESTDKPLHRLGGYFNFITGVAFYVPGRPSLLVLDGPASIPRIDEEGVKREGIALVCPLDRQSCVDAIGVITAKRVVGRRLEVEITRNYLGMAGKPTRYLIVTVPPAP